MSDSDLDLLEAYLDDELSTSDVHALDTRLSEEPELSAALDLLRAERAARISAFQSVMPTVDEAEALADGIVRRVQRRQWTRRTGRYAKVLVGIAACVVIGFSLGRIGTHTEFASHGGPVHTITVGGPAGAANAQLVAQPVAKSADGDQFQVTVFDGNGHQVAAQRFDTREDRHELQVPPGTEGIKVVVDSPQK